ncbi:snf1-activating kinase 1 [Anaeramoeba flamelloides]|uniref:Snf1-activating kinase 1 n=1 Tax=Anaeramoeba flamelloides TaxID=1746091 RepID=A0ABQ8YC25_9EUKA|nr:snf1-activating kinase 1 [Anaeramoeba flamelloides]
MSRKKVIKKIKNQLPSHNSSWGKLKIEREGKNAPVKVKESKIVSVTRDQSTKMINDYQIIGSLGKGSYGKVKKAKRGNEFYAIKIMNKRLLKKKKKGRRKTAFDNVKREIAIMKKLNHANIVKLYEVINDPKSDLIYLVMEFVSGGTLPSEKAVESKESSELVRKYFRDMILGLEYLHFHGIIHRDIKPENLLLDEKGMVKICDFGVSELFDKTDNMRGTAGTPAFFSPEVCAGDDNFSGKAQDIWAVGVTLYNMMFGKLPFASMDVFELFDLIQDAPLKFPPNTEPKLKDLITGLLEKKPENRMSINEIQKHDWVTNYGKHSLTQTKISPITVTEHEIENAMVSRNRFIEFVLLIINYSRWENEVKKKLEKQQASLGTEESNTRLTIVEIDDDEQDEDFDNLFFDDKENLVDVNQITKNKETQTNINLTKIEETQTNISSTKIEETKTNNNSTRIEETFFVTTKTQTENIMVGFQIDEQIWEEIDDDEKWEEIKI